MVRLRSNRWYAADGQHNRQRRVAVQVAGTRRVLSLCFLLALVIVLMQQASNPRHVQQAFRVLGVPLDPASASKPAETSTALADSAAPQAASSSAARSPSSSPTDALPTSPNGSGKWGATCADVIPRILESLTADQQNDLTKFWFARSTSTASGPTAEELESTSTIGKQTSLPSEWAERGLEVIARLIEQTTKSPMAAEEKAEWLVELEQVSSQWQTLCTTPAHQELSTSVSQELRRALTTALDRRLLASLRDASPWTQSESLAFWRLLQRTTATRMVTPQDSSAVPLVDTRQLDAEAHALRGQRVRFRGTAHRVERVEREFAPLNMSDGYWILWLRGEDEALQPVAVYTTDPMAVELAVRVERAGNDYPPLEVQAIFAKRLAYASTDGLQVGPALMANKLIPLSGQPPPLPTVTQQQLGSQFLIAVLAACLLAAAILLPIVWGTLRRGKRKHQTGIGLVLFSTVTCWQVLNATYGQIAWAAPPYQTTATATLHEANSPPWAKSNSDPLTEFLTSDGQIPLTAKAASELRNAMHNRSAPFPNPLLKIVNAISRVGWMQPVHTSRQGPTKITELGEGLQLQERLVAGWVRGATPVVLDESQRDWFQPDERARLYQVDLQVQSTGTTSDAQEGSADASRVELLSIYCERVPAVWLAAAQLRQPAQFATFELVDQAAAGARTLCALAEAPQWLLPKNMSREELAAQLTPPLAPYVLGLGQLGWDLAYLDTIAEHNQKPLSHDEAAGFYSLLRLASSSLEPRGADTGPASQPLALLADATASVGRSLEWRVRIVTGTLVQVADPADRRQLDGEEYVQFDGFVDIGNDRIRFQPVGAAGPAPKLDFSGEFPVTIVAPLNQQLLNSSFVPVQQLDAGQQSWAVGQYATLRGRFYRLWSYQSELVQASTPQGRQVAPLVVASSLHPTTPPVRDQTSNVGWFGWALCGAMLVILTAILWLASRPRG